MSRREIEFLFPNLAHTGYSITSPESIEYNCIAWAAIDEESWWWPDLQNIYYWPSGIPRTETVESFKKAYEILGYIPCDTCDSVIALILSLDLRKLQSMGT